MLIYIVFSSIHQNNKKCEPKLLVRICGGDLAFLYAPRLF